MLSAHAAVRYGMVHTWLSTTGIERLPLLLLLLLLLPSCSCLTSG
jgi:hypothetical protein